MEYLKTFLVVLVGGPLLDLVWFSLVANKMYQRELSSILRLKDGAISVDYAPAVLVYILIALFVTFFVVPKASSLGAAFLWGALGGLILYGVYDLTNLAFLKDWTLPATVADIMWGTFMVAAISTAAVWLKRIL